MAYQDDHPTTWDWTPRVQRRVTAIQRLHRGRTYINTYIDHPPGYGDDVVYAGYGDDLIYARDTAAVDYIDCGGGFDQVETIHRDDKTLSNCERTLGPSRGDIETGG